MKQTLETNNKNKEKNQQIEIDKKPPNLVGTEEENRSAGRADYYVFAFLFWVLVVASRPCFRLIALVSFLLSRDIVGQGIGGAVLAGREIAVGLLGLSL